MREGNEPSFEGIREVRTQWHHSSLTAATSLGDRHIDKSRDGHQPESFLQVTRQTGSHVMRKTEPEE